MKRPVGFAILAVFLWWLTLASVANAALRMGVMHPFWPLAYAVTAFMAGLGLWKVRRWAFHAFLAWSGVLILMMLVMQRAQFRIPLPMFLGFASFTLALLSVGALCISRTLKNLSNKTQEGIGEELAKPSE